MGMMAIITPSAQKSDRKEHFFYSETLLEIYPVLIEIGQAA